MEKYTKLQEEFVQHELTEYGKYLNMRLRQQLEKRKIGITGELLRSLHFQVYKASNDNGSLVQHFAEYGRMVDMGTGKGGFKVGSIKENGEKWKRKPKKWYSKTAWGAIEQLIVQLINGYQDYVMATMKNELISNT